MSRTSLFIAAAAVALALIAGGAWWLMHPAHDRFADCGGTAIAGSSIGGPFTLVDETGRTVTSAELITKPTLIYFGYTFCPDVCPTDSARNADALDLLQKRGIDAQAAFISIDPGRDTVERVREFTNFFHPDMIGLTGSAEQVAAASRAYKTYYAKKDTGDEFYLMDHSTFTYLTLPKSGVVTYFRHGDSAKEIADQAACYIAANQG